MNNDANISLKIAAEKIRSSREKVKSDWNGELGEKIELFLDGYEKNIVRHYENVDYYLKQISAYEDRLESIISGCTSSDFEKVKTKHW